MNKIKDREEKGEERYRRKHSEMPEYSLLIVNGDGGRGLICLESLDFTNLREASSKGSEYR